MLVWIPMVGAAAVMGATSIPHCAAMCGPLACAACGEGEAQGRTAGAYALGRLVSYGLGGVAVAALGSTLLHRLDAARVHHASAALMALALGFSAYRLWRSGSSSPLVPLRRGRGESSVRRALGLGLLTGVLPCGALVSAMLLAAGAGAWWTGGLVMLTYALASAPGTLGPALAGAAVGRRVGAGGPWVRRGLSVAMLLAAVWVAARPWMIRTGHCSHCHDARAEAPALPQGGHG